MHRSKTNSRQIKKNARIPVIWRHPPKDWLKINVDSAFNSSSKKGFAAVLITDNTRMMRGDSASTFTTNSNLMAKAIALRETLIMAKNLQIQQWVHLGSTEWKQVSSPDCKSEEKLNPADKLVLQPTNHNTEADPNRQSAIESVAPSAAMIALTRIY
ncbi:hypothetical protein PIB30_081087 [Stylosanthes scabra]|uniref:RNase H type-1 domain-containing protein n=1 Tax=Stylosanthes scabra TaxID=79078 RepID=A0ABU6ZQ80_9FABA|nr:hypothetical protein [Stylosanthes scabra]